MRYKLLFIIFYFMGQLVVEAQVSNPTWAEHIAPILYKQCVSCHRSGAIAPFELLTYQDAYLHRFAVENAVVSRHMPPFPPDTKYQRYAAENVLTDAQIQTIKNWVTQNAPQGDPSVAPAVPNFPRGSQVGTPDAVLRAPTYTVPNLSSDLYRCFVVPSGVNVDRFLSAVEVIPGNANIVHHVLIYQDTTGRGRVLDAADPEPGYTSFGGVGIDNPPLIGSWVPGAKVRRFPQNMGVRLARNSDLIVQIHYPRGSTGQVDSTKINLFFTPNSTGVREIRNIPLINHVTSLTNGPLSIPANTTRTFNARFTAPLEVTAITVGPHMHLIGRSIKSWVITPQGDTIKLINIPNWSFHWQGNYMFQKLLRIPRFSRIEAQAFYDNTTNNPFQPSNPPRNVQLGEATTDEMMLIYFSFTPYQAGDENIVTDSTIITSNEPLPNYEQGYFLKIFPSPAKDFITLHFHLPKEELVTMQLWDMQGKCVKTWRKEAAFQAGLHEWNERIDDLPNGVYVATLTAQNGQKIFYKFMKQ